MIEAPELARERVHDRRGDAVDGVRLVDHRHLRKFGRRRVDMAARGDDERDAARAHHAGDRPDILALQVDVEDGQIEAAGVNRVACLADRFTNPLDLMAERIKKILQHHRDERFVLDDQDDVLLDHKRLQ